MHKCWFVDGLHSVPACSGRAHGMQSLEILTLDHHGRILDFVSEVSEAQAIGCLSSCDCLGCIWGSWDLLKEKFLLSHLSVSWDTILDRKRNVNIFGAIYHIKYFPVSLAQPGTLSPSLTPPLSSPPWHPYTLFKGAMFLLLPWLPPCFPHASHSQTITSICWP